MHCLVILLSVTFSLSSNNSHGFEGFFLSDGTLVVGVTWKKEYTTAMVHSVILNDHQWHSVCISFNPSRCEIVLRSRLSAVFFIVYFYLLFRSRRLFGQSHLSVYVDGTLRLTVNVRIPPIGEVLTFIFFAFFFFNNCLL